jgi:hypothetical protein
MQKQAAITRKLKKELETKKKLVLIISCNRLLERNKTN